jgi:hypothetical protein
MVKMNKELNDVTIQMLIAALVIIAFIIISIKY